MNQGVAERILKLNDHWFGSVLYLIRWLVIAGAIMIRGLMSTSSSQTPTGNFRQ
jgi:hypothetical protein